MTALLDVIAGTVRELLGEFVPDGAATLWLPMLVGVLWLATVLFLRRALVPLGRVARVVLTGVAVAGGALLLLPEFGAATLYRRASQRPPALLYDFGDVVATGTNAVGTWGAATLTSVTDRMSRVHPLVALALVALWIWLWNRAACPDHALTTGTCARPVSAWWAALET